MGAQHRRRIGRPVRESRRGRRGMFLYAGCQPEPEPEYPASDQASRGARAGRRP
jgi:hypothetical protein